MYSQLRLTFCRKAALLLFVGLLTACGQNTKEQTAPEAVANYEFPFQNPDLSLEDRLNDLTERLTVDEKISQLRYTAPAIERLGIPAYNWWNEALHGVARAGRATVFPQAIGMASTFDSELLESVATAISDEARAKYNANVANGNRGRYAGLTFWTPNVNIFRDPRWGRGQETYGEDPYLTGRLGAAFVRGLQGDDPKYLKSAACAKHYVVHSGPEKDRHIFDAVASEKDLYETYLPAFRQLVDANVEAVMCAYNRTNGEPCCGSPRLLQDILRKEFGFEGHIVSDCWALIDFHEGHKVTAGSTESAALALNSGVDLNCGDTYPFLSDALAKGLIDEQKIDQAFKRLFRTRFKLGMFDPSDRNPYDAISPDVINSEEHQQLALEVARKSIVMLKNDNALPLKKDIPYVFVTGPHATSAEVLLGNYFGTSANMVTILEGINNEISNGTLLQYKQGFLLDRENVNPMDWTTGEAQEADAVIITLGISGLLEGEEGESIASTQKGDRFDMDIPQNQVDFLKNLREGYKGKIIAVITGGSPMQLDQVEENSDAILFAWYPGEQGGQAVADIIFGNVNPSGRLPISFPKSVKQLPDYADYDMSNRTYRYMQDQPQYPFGYGLSYSEFVYSDLKLENSTINAEGATTVSCTISNNSTISGTEVVQLYITDDEASFRVPIQSLKGVQQVELAAGESMQVSFTIGNEELAQINMEGKTVIEPGTFTISVGGSSPSQANGRLGLAAPVTASLTVM